MSAPAPEPTPGARVERYTRQVPVEDLGERYRRRRADADDQLTVEQVADVQVDADGLVVVTAELLAQLLGELGWSRVVDEPEVEL